MKKISMLALVGAFAVSAAHAGFQGATAPAPAVGGFVGGAEDRKSVV